MTYLLPCTGCQQSIPVEIAQAGETVRCDCGADVPVPTLGKLRRLPTVDSVVPGGQKIIAGSTSWNKSRGRFFEDKTTAFYSEPIKRGRYIFALGFLVAAISAGTAVFYYASAARIELGDAHGDQLEMGEQLIDALTAEGAYEAWKMLRIQGIGEKTKPDYMIQEEKREGYQAKFRMALYVFALGLLVMAVGIFVIKPRSSPSP
jgi:hypothetical protein